MGIASDYVESEDVLVVVWDGPVSGAAWKQNIGEQVEDDPAWPLGRRRLIDLTTVDPSEISSTDIAVVIAFARDRIQHVAGRRQAVVAALAWDLAQEFARRSTELGATTIVFDRFDAACTWLGVDAAVARPVAQRLRAGLRVNG